MARVMTLPGEAQVDLNSCFADVSSLPSTWMVGEWASVVVMHRDGFGNTIYPPTESLGLQVSYAAAPFRLVRIRFIRANRTYETTGGKSSGSCGWYETTGGKSSGSCGWYETTGGKSSGSCG
jgi:hypothetical protein